MSAFARKIPFTKKPAREGRVRIRNIQAIHEEHQRKAHQSIPCFFFFSAVITVRDTRKMDDDTGGQACHPPP